MGVASLSAAHILENMEIGHNVIHGQYDFMKDEKFNSDYEWTMAGNISAQVIRNLWSFAVIYCGHLPEGNYSFTEQKMEAETKGQWYFRQILGSSNFEGSLWVHIMSGHLSHQIEHHLYPDLPAWRYREMGPKVEEICGRYGIPYQTGKMVPMLKTVASSMVKYSVPDVASQKLGRFFKTKKNL